MTKARYMDLEDFQTLWDDVIKPAIPSIAAAGIEGKANKVDSATAGHLAGLDASGDLTDTGKSSALLNPAVAPDAVQGTNGSDGIMTAADKGKLAGIEAGAEVNVNADWNASSGDAQILNKPTLGTAAAKGVAQEVNTSENLVQSNHVKTYVDNATGAINEKIPTQASSSNQLADKEFVNSSIQTATADYKGCFNLVSDLELTTEATHADIAAALATAIQTSDNNDYAFVQIPTGDETPTEIASIDRYKKGSSAWEYEYTLNNSGYTAAQWAAINSTITSGLVAKLSALPTNSELTTLLGAKVSTSDVQSSVDTSSKIPTAGAVKTYVDGRTLVPVDMNALTPSSTFVEGNVMGINGILYRAKRNTSSFPVTFAIEDGDFVTHTVNGNIAYVITSWTLNTDWEVFMDASIGYTLASKQDALVFDTTPTSGSNNMVKSGAIKAAIDAMGATKQNTLTFDSAPTANSNNPVTSGGVKAALDTLGNAKISTSEKGVNNGVAELDSTGKVPASQLPSFVDDVIEAYYNTVDGKFYTTKSGDTYSGEITPESGKIYVDLTSNKTYRWGGSAYVVISETLALGETETTAYRGDRGKIAYDHSQDSAVHVTSADKLNYSKVFVDVGSQATADYKLLICASLMSEDGFSAAQISSNSPTCSPITGEVWMKSLKVGASKALGESVLLPSTQITVGNSTYTVSQLLQAMVSLMDKTVVYQPSAS